MSENKSKERDNRYMGMVCINNLNLFQRCPCKSMSKSEADIHMYVMKAHELMEVQKEWTENRVEQ